MLAKCFAMWSNHISVQSLATRFLFSLLGSSATYYALKALHPNTRALVCLLGKHRLHFTLLWALCSSVPLLVTNTAHCSKYTLLILLKAAGSTTILRTSCILLDLGRFSCLLLASALGLTLALLQPLLLLCFCIWLAAFSLLAITPAHEGRIIALSYELSFLQCWGWPHLHSFALCIFEAFDIAVQCFICSGRWALSKAAPKNRGVAQNPTMLCACCECIYYAMGIVWSLKSLA